MEITKFEPHFNSYLIFHSGNYIICDIFEITIHLGHIISTIKFIPIKTLHEKPI